MKMRTRRRIGHGRMADALAPEQEAGKGLARRVWALWDGSPKIEIFGFKLAYSRSFGDELGRG